MPRKILRHTKQTPPQREFWGAGDRYRLFVGGVGSGKTRAGCVEVLRQPAGSTGMVLAPTYPMLRDATLRTFLDLVRRAGVLRSFNKAEMTATLGGGRTVLFRSADDPDRLRGPNLGWFWMDEAAMCAEEAWMVMIGRLRELPARGWCTTTPRGKNWLYKVFTEGGAGYHVTRASSRTNQYLPTDFVRSLLDAYDSQFALQEVEGEFLDDAFGQLIPDWWVDRLPDLVRPARPGGSRWMTADLGEGGGRDSAVILVGDSLGILHGEEDPWMGPGQAASRMVALGREWDVRQDRWVYDAGGGRGLDIAPFFEQHGVTEAIGYRGSKEGGEKYFLRRCKMAFRLRDRLNPERPKPLPPLRHDEDRRPSVFDPPPDPTSHEIQPPFTLPAIKPWWPLLREELKNLKYFHKGKRFALEPKEELQKRIRRSPNVLDALMMSFCLGDDD